MSHVIESPRVEASRMLPFPAQIATKRLVFLENDRDEARPPAPAEASDDVAGQQIDEATAAKVLETRFAFFAAWDAGAAHRIKQGHLLRAAQAQLAKYGAGTFTAMLLAPRPGGFGFKSATTAYDLIAEAEGKPKRSHKSKASKVSTPRRSNQTMAQLPINLDGAKALSVADDITENLLGLPTTLDTSHTDTYVPFHWKGVYIPKADVEGVKKWLQTISNAELSLQFLSWYRAANVGTLEEESDETNPSIQ